VEQIGVGGFLTFLLVFVITSQALAFAIALIARVWAQHTDPVVLHGIEQARAHDLVASYLESLHDTRFGFPTGVFRIDSGQSTPAKVVAREVNFQGSTGFRLARFAMVIPALFVEAAADAGCAVGAVALFLGIAFAMFLVVPILAISIMEVVLRALMRSRITAKLQPVAGEENACSVEFELAGLSAFGARKPLMSGLAKPALPPQWGGATLQPGSEPWQADRLNQVYLVGSLVAIAVAATVVATSPRIGGNTGQYTQAQYSNTQNIPSTAGTGAGESTTPQGPGTQGAPTTPSPSPSSLPAPSQTIQLHFKRLGEGNYEGAFALMSEAYRSGNPKWVEDRETAEPEINIIGVGPPHYGHASARVYVKFYARDRNTTPGSDTRCRLFRGFVHMIEHGDVWRYEPVGNNLSAIVEPAGDSNCHG
jgi:hypothetical protein